VTDEPIVAQVLTIAGAVLAVAVLSHLSNEP
jgi:hypothetical protein